MPDQRLALARQKILEAQTNGVGIVVLTGAGVSAASGVPTFRESQTGLWARFSPEELASPSAYARNPTLVWDWYMWRLQMVRQAEPNKAHVLLAHLEKKCQDNFVLVTQNVDGLHARAGSKNIVELHGNILEARCEKCGHVQDLPLQFVPPPICKSCAAACRPNVVWFGEQLPLVELQKAHAAFVRSSVVLVIGTSGLVEPAASLARLTMARGGFVIEINPELTPLSNDANCVLQQDAVSGLENLLTQN